MALAVARAAAKETVTATPMTQSQQTSRVVPTAEPPRIEIVVPTTAPSPPASTSSQPTIRRPDAYVEDAPSAQQLFDAHEKKVAQHFMDGRDAQWAKPAEDAFRSDFASDRLGLRDSVSLLAIDCRMSSCVGTVEWKDANVAQARWKTVLQTMYKTNCATSISLPPPADPPQSGPVQAHLYFDCADLRAGGQ
jgi:hypothetical protein